MTYNAKYENLGLKDYKETWDYQEKIFQEIVDKKKSTASTGTGNIPPGTLIFVEHPHVYTLGKNGSQSNLLLNYIQLKAKEASFYKIDRGGDITYHGPGQLVVYPIFDLEVMGLSLKDYIQTLEEAVLRCIDAYGIKGGRLKGATGVWLDAEDTLKARKICAIGVRASRYVTMHGLALNVNTDLDYFKWINPCGITDKGVTSFERELGEKQDLSEISLKLKQEMQSLFNLKWI